MNVSGEGVTELNLSSCSEDILGVYIVYRPNPALSSNLLSVLSTGCSPKRGGDELCGTPAKGRTLRPTFPLA